MITTGGSLKVPHVQGATKDKEVMTRHNTLTTKEMNTRITMSEGGGPWIADTQYYHTEYRDEEGERDIEGGKGGKKRTSS